MAWIIMKWSYTFTRNVWSYWTLEITTKDVLHIEWDDIYVFSWNFYYDCKTKRVKLYSASNQIYDIVSVVSQMKMTLKGRIIIGEDSINYLISCSLI